MSLWNCPAHGLHGPSPGNICPKCGVAMSWATIVPPNAQHGSFDEVVLNHPSGDHVAVRRTVAMCSCEDWLNCEHPWPMLAPPIPTGTMAFMRWLEQNYRVANERSE